MKKFLAIILIVGVGLNDIAAQQLHQLTQYMDNQLIFNPAAAGSTDVIDAKVGYRSQWTGLDDGPSTVYLSGHTNLADNRSVGLGVTLFSDVTGPTSRQGGQLAYAYHLPLENNSFLGIGVSGTFFQYRIEFDDFVPGHEFDPMLLNGQQSKMSGDVNFGLYYYGNNFWVSASALQLLEREVAFLDDASTVPLNRHYFAGAGYTFDINQDFSIEPSFFVKSVTAIPVHLDLNARVIYQQAYWLGIGYRTQDAVNVMLGLDLNDSFKVSYSYDFNTTDLREYANGSHEFTLGFRWDYRDTGLPTF